MYVLYMQAGATVDVFAVFETYDDAFEVGELYNWRYLDENDFEWSLDIECL